MLSFIAAGNNIGVLLVAVCADATQGDPGSIFQLPCTGGTESGQGDDTRPFWGARDSGL